MAVGVPAPARAQVPALRLPPGFRADVVATGLSGPRALAFDPAGTLLVSLPGEGRVVALAGGVITVAAQLDRPHGLVIRDRHLYVAETGRILRFRYDARTRSARGAVPIVRDLPHGGHHWARSLAFGPDGRLYVAIGSSCDACRERDSRRAAIVSYAADGSQARVFATGLRNPVGLAFEPRRGVLWTTVNERDWRSGGAPPDYVTVVREGASYGWPSCFAAGGTFARDPELRSELDRADCRKMTLPTLELPPHSAPLGLTFYGGRQFPPEYRGDLFVALHGSRPGLPAVGHKIIRIRRASYPPRAEDFATGFHEGERVLGRPVDVLVGSDGALYVSDDHAGAIYRIRFAP
jgi:glucose/arabinose dehydrogenase